MAADGTLYIGDSGNNKIWKADVTAGTTAYVAGSGSFTSAGDGLVWTSSSVSFRSPDRLAKDYAGNLYISEYFNNVSSIVHVIIEYFLDESADCHM